MSTLTITIPAFAQGDWIPTVNTARGQDVSPEIRLDGIAPEAMSLLVTMDDASHPLFPNYNHWVMRNVPVVSVVPAGLPKAERLDALGGAVQGLGYGKHVYKGPKPPLRSIHLYTFTVYALDCMLNLSPDSARDAVLLAAKGHILQQATYQGKFQSRRKPE